MLYICLQSLHTRAAFVHSGLVPREIITTFLNLSYLVSEVSSQIIVLPSEVMVIQLCQTGPEHVLTTEEWMVGKDQSRNINIELEVPLKFCSTGNIQTGTWGLKGLGGRQKDPPCARNASN